MCEGNNEYEVCVVTSQNSFTQASDMQDLIKQKLDEGFKIYKLGEVAQAFTLNNGGADKRHFTCFITFVKEAAPLAI